MSKPYVIEYDSDGKAHYPDHSLKSFEMYCDKWEYDEFAEMIKHDMGFHTLKGCDLIEHCKLDNANHLYATAWAELYANSELFGGFNSDSFKIKRKKLIKALKYLN